jgi:trimethylguanosine synthase
MLTVLTGPGYRREKIFNLETMQPYGLSEIYDKMAKMTRNMVLFLPRTSDLRQIAAKVEDGKQAQVVHYYQRGRDKALCTYFGEWGTVDFTG